MWLLVQLALAEEINLPVDIAEQQLQLQSKMDVLEQQLEQAHQEKILLDEYYEFEQEKLALLKLVLNTRADIATRKAAIDSLCVMQSQDAPLFFWEILGDDKEVSTQIVQSLAVYQLQENGEEFTQEILSVLDKALYMQVPVARHFQIHVGFSPPSIDTEIDTVLASQALQTMAKLQQPIMAQSAWNYAQDIRVPYQLRQEAVNMLEQHYPAIIAEKGKPILEKADDMFANRLYAASMATSTSVLLGSVGVWGQNSASETIGYMGGALLGATGGWLLAKEQHPTLGQASLMASSVAWGLGEGQMISRSFDMTNGNAALFRTLGVMGGVGYAYRARERDTKVSDVLETDFLGYMGGQIAVGVRDIIGDTSSDLRPNYDDFYDYSVQMTQEDINAADQAYYAAEEAYYVKKEELNRQRFKTAVLGSTLGLGVAHVITPKWNVRPQGALFSGVYGTQAAIASSLAMDAYDVEHPDGIVRLAIHGVAGGALLYDHFRPTTYTHSVLSAYTTGTGYFLGFGIPALLDMEWKSSQKFGLWSGITGTFAGTYLADKSKLSDGDWISTGVGLGISAWHFGMLSTVLSTYDNPNYQLPTGVFLTGMGASTIGLGMAGQKYDLSSTNTIFLGSATAWGAYYGGLLPMALGVEDQWTGRQRAATMLAVSDVFLLSGVYASVVEKYDVRRSAIPQILGVGGATIGSLGAFLFTDSSQMVTLASLGGATLGLVGGAYVERSTHASVEAMNNISDTFHASSVKLPKMRLQMTPQVQQDGSMGMYIGLSN